MANVRIVSCRAAHIAEIARTMRSEDRAEITATGMQVKHFLFRLYAESPLYRRAALVDGEVAAVWGDMAPLLATEGQMWLLTAPPVERVPLAFMREVKAHVKKHLEVRSVLRADASAEYERALRFFKLAGFDVLPTGSDGSAARRELRIERKG